MVQKTNVEIAHGKAQKKWEAKAKAAAKVKANPPPTRPPRPSWAPNASNPTAESDNVNPQPPKSPRPSRTSSSSNVTVPNPKNLTKKKLSSAKRGFAADSLDDEPAKVKSRRRSTASKKRCTYPTGAQTPLITTSSFGRGPVFLAMIGLRILILRVCTPVRYFTITTLGCHLSKR